METVFYNIVVDFYKKYNKDSIGNIPDLLEKYKDSEVELIKNLFQKYSGNPLEFVFFKDYLDKHFEEFLTSFYSKFNPDKVNQVIQLVNKYSENKEDFLRQLVVKYQIQYHSLINFIDFQKILIVDSPTIHVSNLPSKEENKDVSKTSPLKYLIVIGVVVVLGIVIVGGIYIHNKQNIQVNLSDENRMKEQRILDSTRVADSMVMVMSEQQRVTDSINLVRSQMKEESTPQPNISNVQSNELTYLSPNNGNIETLILNKNSDGTVENVTYMTSKTKKRINLIISKQSKNYLEVMFPNDKQIYKLNINGENMICKNPDNTTQNYYLSVNKGSVQ